MSEGAAGFDRLEWHDDRMVLDDLVFRLTDHSREPADDNFDLYKRKGMFDRYAKRLGGLTVRNVVELGIWDGGSTALWCEVLAPKKLVAFDLDTRGDSPYFKAWRASRGFEDRVRTCWGADQADGDMLRAVVAEECDGPLDLVIDDASHLYGPTKASFETLFPLLRPGGLYVIEDWHWGHLPDWQAPDHPWAAEQSLTQLVWDLVEVAGSERRPTIKSLWVVRGMTVVERGSVPLDLTFRLEDRIVRRPGWG